MLIETQDLITAVINRVNDLDLHPHMASAIAKEFVWLKGLTGTVSFRHDKNMLDLVKMGEYDNDIEHAWLIIMDAPEEVQT